MDCMWDEVAYTCDGCGELTHTDEPLQDLVFCTTCQERYYQPDHSSFRA